MKIWPLLCAGGIYPMCTAEFAEIFLVVVNEAY
jgi:hypothetical protein